MTMKRRLERDLMGEKQRPRSQRKRKFAGTAPSVATVNELLSPLYRTVGVAASCLSSLTCGVVNPRGRGGARGLDPSVANLRGNEPKRARWYRVSRCCSCLINGANDRTKRQVLGAISRGRCGRCLPIPLRRPFSKELAVGLARRQRPVRLALRSSARSCPGLGPGMGHR